jgi:short-subunit dehydrogenase
MHLNTLATQSIQGRVERGIAPALLDVGATKAIVIALSLSLHELAGKNVRPQAVPPGATATD